MVLGQDQRSRVMPSWCPYFTPPYLRFIRRWALRREEAFVMYGAEGARRRRTPRRGRGSTRDERRARPQVRSDERLCQTVKPLNTALRAAGEKRERRKVLAHSMTRKRQRWPPPQAAAGRPQVRTVSDERFSHTLRRRSVSDRAPRRWAFRRAEEAYVMSGAEGARRRRTPRRG